MSSPSSIFPPEAIETNLAQTEADETRDGNETSSHGAVEPDVIQQPTTTTTTITPADLVDSPPPSSETLPGSGSSSPLSIPSPRSPLRMPGLADLTLHSPSSQIIGTPFATTTTTRFEYPFPESSSTGSPSSSSPDHSPSFSSSFMGPNGVYPGMVSSSVSGFASIFPPPSSSSSSSSAGQTVSGLYPSSADSLPAYTTYTFNSPAHPKMRMRTEPPIPPSLAKKRNKWSLNLLLRRKSSQGSSSTGGASEAESGGTTSPGGSTDGQPMSPSRLTRTAMEEEEGPQGRGK